MPQKYLQLLTHGVIQVDLNKPPKNFIGVSSKTPNSGEILIIAKSKDHFLSLYTLWFVNTDCIMPYFSKFTSNYEIKFIFHARMFYEEKKFYTNFLDRFETSLENFNISRYTSEMQHYCHSPMVGIKFDFSVIELFNQGSITFPPFKDARMVVNQMNFFAVNEGGTKHVDYKLDLQFDGNVLTTVPKLSSPGHILWGLLQKNNLQLITDSPYFHKFIKELIIHEHNNLQKLLVDYADYLTIIKNNGKKYMKLCNQKFKENKFSESTENARKALENFLLLNELHVLDELSLTYYNLGSALLKENKRLEAKDSLQTAKEFTERIRNLERLEKIKSKLGIIEKPVIFSLPKELLLDILEKLDLPDIAAFAQTSSYSAQIAREGLFWQRKLFNDFTKKVLPETEMAFQKQYKEKYLLMPKRENRPPSLNDAIKLGAEVLFQKLVNAGSKLNTNASTIRNLFRIPNIDIIMMAFQHGLTINTPLKIQSNIHTSVFHIALFEAPHLLPMLAKNPEEITILPRLYVAIICNDMMAFEKSLKDNSNIDEEDLCDCTALWWAVVLNRESMAKRLKEKHADYTKLLNKSNCLSIFLQYNILEYLISQNQKESLELLLTWGLSANTFLVTTATYKNLLVIAAEHGNRDIIELLQSYGAMDVKNLDNIEISRLISNAGFLCERLYPNAFCAAAEKGYVNCLEHFLSTGTDINALGNITTYDHKDIYIENNTGLFFAVSNLKVEAVEFLLNKKADPNEPGIHLGYEKNIQFKNEKKFILNTLADQLCFKNFGFTKSHYSPQHPKMREWFDILNLLLKHDADVNQSNFIIYLMRVDMTIKVRESSYQYSYEPMGDSLARQNFIIDVFKLVMNQTDFSKQDTKGKTALHYASEQGLIDVVRFLVEEVKIDISIRDENNETAIFKAARNLHKNIYSYLKEKGTDIGIDVDMHTNRDENTPLQVASKSFSGWF